MSLEKKLQVRSVSVCELCGNKEDLEAYILPPDNTSNLDNAILACKICVNQFANQESMDANHWRCLNDSMWSEHRAVKIMAWRMLHRLKSEDWANDLLDMIYIEDEDLEYAKSTEAIEDENAVVHRDVNGVIIQAGDSVVLIKDLKVKGSSMVAKQGTAVRRVSLDRDNAEYIEGKVDGQHIVIITKYVKKI